MSPAPRPLGPQGVHQLVGPSGELAEGQGDARRGTPRWPADRDGPRRSTRIRAAGPRGASSRIEYTNNGILPAARWDDPPRCRRRPSRLLGLRRRRLSGRFAHRDVAAAGRTGPSWPTWPAHGAGSSCGAPAAASTPGPGPSSSGWITSSAATSPRRTATATAPTSPTHLPLDAGPRRLRRRPARGPGPRPRRRRGVALPGRRPPRPRPRRGRPAGRAARRE